MESCILAKWLLLAALANTTDDPQFQLARTRAFAAPSFDLTQGPPSDAGPALCPSVPSGGWTCTWTSDAFSAGQTVAAGPVTTGWSVFGKSSVTPPALIGSIIASGPGPPMTMGIPGTLDAGTALVAILAATAASALGAPAGWSGPTSLLLPTDAVAVFFKTLQTGDPTSFTFQATDAGRWAGTIIYYEGLDASGLTSGLTVESTAGSGITSFPPPNIWDDSVLFVGYVDWSAGAWNLPADLTVLSSTQNFVGFAVGARSLRDAGVISSETATAANAGSLLAFTVVVPPAGPYCAVTETATLGGQVVDQFSFPESAALGTFETHETVSPTIPARSLAGGETLQVTFTAPADAGCSLQVAFDNPATPSFVLLPGLDGGTTTPPRDSGAASDSGQTPDAAGSADGGAGHGGTNANLGCGCGGGEVGFWLVMLPLLGLICPRRSRSIPRQFVVTAPSFALTHTRSPRSSRYPEVPSERRARR